MGRACETCGMTRWEGRQVEGGVESMRRDIEAQRTQIDALARAGARLMAAYTAEEAEYGFPFNFELRDAHRSLAELLVGLS
jgi:hypothetical protein